nr:hypothetical protein [Tanacetum cinerariifolium]
VLGLCGGSDGGVMGCSGSGGEGRENRGRRVAGLAGFSGVQVVLALAPRGQAYNLERVEPKERPLHMGPLAS